jgi:hypothetical protein
MIRLWKRNRPVAVGTILAAVVLLTACGKEETPGSNRTGPTKSSSAKIVITGIVNNTFTPEEISLFKVADSVGINFVEKFPCGVSLQFPMDLKPGTYPITDHLHSPSGKVFGNYSPDCGKTGTYMSTGGTLNLTTASGTYTGTFEFAAGLNRDDSKKINVSGSFADLKLQ